jgi:hypothetical protein
MKPVELLLPFCVGRSPFWPFEVGVDELPSAFGGWVSAATCAFNAAIRFCAAASYAISARISASLLAWLSLLRSGGWISPPLESSCP